MVAGNLERVLSRSAPLAAFHRADTLEAALDGIGGPEAPAAPGDVRAALTALR